MGWAVVLTGALVVVVGLAVGPVVVASGEQDAIRATDARVQSANHNLFLTTFFPPTLFAAKSNMTLIICQ
jgi:hypothetical protein